MIQLFESAALEKYAEVLLWALQASRRKRFINGDTVLLRYDASAFPLAELMFRRLLQRKLNVVARCLISPMMERDFFMVSNSAQRKFVAKGERELFASLAGNVLLSAPESLTHLADVDPKRINETVLVRKELRRIMEKNEDKGLFGWTLCTLTTKALAEKARCSLEDYSNQIIKACFLDEVDPVAKWKEIHAQSNSIKKWLGSLSISRIEVQGDNIDLEINLGEKRRFLGTSGHNIPSFEIFTSPDWRGTRGIFFADQPSYKNGNYVSGVRLRFDRGRAIEISAEMGESFVRKTLKTDPGACRVGEFSLTDRRFSRIDRFMADTLFDENFGGKFGNCHIAVGSSYSDTFDGNPSRLTKSVKDKLGYNDSALHWDLVNTEKKTVTAVLADGKRKIIYDQGQFTI